MHFYTDLLSESLASSFDASESVLRTVTTKTAAVMPEVTGTTIESGNHPQVATQVADTTKPAKIEETWTKSEVISSSAPKQVTPTVVAQVTSEPEHIKTEQELEAERQALEIAMKKEEQRKKDERLKRKHDVERRREEEKQAVFARLDDPAEEAFRRDLMPQDHEIAVMIRTGHEVEYRLRGPLESYLKGRENQLFIASDLDSTYGNQTIYDCLARLSDRPKVAQSERFKHYEALKQRVVEQKKGDEPYDYSKKESQGWHLDAMKFVSSVEMGYEKLGHDYKWYLLLDDDTYVQWESMKAIVSRLDYHSNHFIGMGFWIMADVPYAQGGAGMLVSQAAMKSRFVDHKDSMGDVHDRSSTARFADHHFATVMYEIDIYVDNTYMTSFHEHEFVREKVYKDDLCKPVVTYHHLSVDEMHKLHDNFGKVEFKHSTMLELLENPADLKLRKNWSYNLEKDDGDRKKEEARQDMITIVADTKHNGWMTEERCEKMCTELYDNCLAWTYLDEGERTCLMSDHFRLGYAKQGATTGINEAMLSRMARECKPYP